MKTTLPICVLLLALLFTVNVAQTPAKRFDLEAAAKLVRLSDPNIAPDGKSIVVVVARANYEDNRWENELVLVDVASSAQRVLTSGRYDVSQPRWSPSGDRLAFISAAPTGKESKPQIFVLAMNGGEAKRITSAPNGVQHYAWRPDGQEIAFVTADESSNKKIGDKEISFEVGDNDYLATSTPTSSHLWAIAADGSKARRLTSGSWSLAPFSRPISISSFSWSPDGKSITFVRQARPHFGGVDQITVQLLDVATGEMRQLTRRTVSEIQPLFSPDGSHLAYQYPRDFEHHSVSEIWVAMSAGGEGTCVTRAIDRNLTRHFWMPDGKALLVGGNDGTRVSLWLQPLGGPARKLDLGNVIPTNPLGVDVNLGRSGAIAFAGGEAQRPTELYYLASTDAPVKRLTDFNREVAALALGKVEKIEWQGPDGFREDGVLTYPPDFRPEKKYPLVLSLHGGPASASKEVFSERSQLIAAQGYVVFEPNYRGSDNLGNAYQRAIVGDTGDGPGRDVMAGIEAVKKRGFVDSDRLAVSGWSYGGFMTTWLSGHYQVWKAAIAGAALTDWFDAYNLSDLNVWRRYSIGGSPWVDDQAKLYSEQSPITYAAKIRTPTLILSDTGDIRVPITQSYKLYHALRDNNVPVKFIAYPVSGHSPSDPVRQRDVNRRWIEWLEKYLKPAATSQN